MPNSLWIENSEINDRKNCYGAFSNYYVNKNILLASKIESISLMQCHGWIVSTECNENSGSGSNIQ